MRIMEGSDSSRELLENVTMAEVSTPFMMQRIGVEPQLLSSELLPSHGGLVVDMTNNEYLPTVSYATDDLLEHDLTEEDRNLAAALVAVQLVQQQKQQQLHQDSNVIVSTNSLASLVSSSNLGDNSKVDLDNQQLVITPVEKPVISTINNSYIGLEERQLNNHDVVFKKYGNLTVEPLKNEYVCVKSENDESLQQKDSDCENKNDARSSKKSLPHKKRISRKLQKKPAVSKKVFKCQTCDQTFNTAEELSSHTGTCHSVNIVVQPNPFSCQICGILCHDQLLFFQHLKSHYEPNFNTINTTSANNLQDKADVSNTENDDSNKEISLLQTILQPLNCNQCGKIFRRQKAYEAHIQNAHSKQVEDEFSEPEDLMEGIRSVVEAHDADTDEEMTDSKGWHYNNALADAATVDPTVPLDDQNRICRMCGQIFNTHTEVIQHLTECKANIDPKLEQSSDTEDGAGNNASGAGNKNRVRKKRRRNGSLYCQHCDRVFSHRNSLMYHLRGHTGERPHQCDICGKSFFAASALKVHMRLHSGDKPYKCEFCGRHFRQWGDLKYHCISIHSDEKNYQCEYCGKDFARKYSLIVHRRIHTGEKNYRCEFCGKTFRASSYLQNHRRIHTGEKPHPCEICGKPFRVRSDMKRHLNTHARRKAGTIVPRLTTNTGETLITEGTDPENSSSLAPDDDRLIAENHINQDHEDAMSEGSDVQYQVPRDPLEGVREGTNTLFTNGHLLICYQNDLDVKPNVETIETE